MLSLSWLFGTDNDDGNILCIFIGFKGVDHSKAVHSRHLNIQGDDIATLMKYMQVSPWMWVYKSELDLKNPKHAVVTITHCPTLLSLEKEGTGREKPICQQLEPKLMNIMAHFFNPEIKIKGLKVPPRTDYDDCCCKWEFTLE